MGMISKMKDTNLFEQLDEINEYIKSVKYQLEDIENTLRDSIDERNAIIREIERQGGEIDWG